MLFENSSGTPLFPGCSQLRNSYGEPDAPAHSGDSSAWRRTATTPRWASGSRSSTTRPCSPRARPSRTRSASRSASPRCSSRPSTADPAAPARPSRASLPQRRASHVTNMSRVSCPWQDAVAVQGEGAVARAAMPPVLESRSRPREPSHRHAKHRLDRHGEGHVQVPAIELCLHDANRLVGRAPVVNDHRPGLQAVL